MKTLRRLVAALAIAATAQSSLAVPCSSTTNWLGLGPPGIEFFGASFGSTGDRVDCYSFSLSGDTAVFGGIVEINTLFNLLDIDVTSVSVFAGLASGNQTSGVLLGADTSPLAFSFGLPGGDYTFAVASTVNQVPGLWKVSVGYGGAMATVASTVPVVTVPEPSSLALVGIAMLGLLALRWRTRRAGARLGRSRCSVIGRRSIAPREPLA